MCSTLSFTYIIHKNITTPKLFFFVSYKLIIMLQSDRMLNLGNYSFNIKKISGQNVSLSLLIGIYINLYFR